MQSLYNSRQMWPGKELEQLPPLHTLHTHTPTVSSHGKAHQHCLRNLPLFPPHVHPSQLQPYELCDLDKALDLPGLNCLIYQIGRLLS